MYRERDTHVYVYTLVQCMLCLNPDIPASVMSTLKGAKSRPPSFR